MHSNFCIFNEDLWRKEISKIKFLMNISFPSWKENTSTLPSRCNSLLSSTPSHLSLTSTFSPPFSSSLLFSPLLYPSTLPLFFLLSLFPFPRLPSLSFPLPFPIFFPPFPFYPLYFFN